MDFLLNQVSVSLRPPTPRGDCEHDDDDEESCYGALFDIQADLFLGTIHIGSVNAILVDRQAIPENCFHETFDKHGAAMEWVGTSLMENRYGRIRLQSLHYYDDPEYDFMYITSFHVISDLGSTTFHKSDLASAALHKFLHEPTRIKGNLQFGCWRVSSAAYVVSVPQLETNPNGSNRKRKRQASHDSNDHQGEERERAARWAAEPFLRNGFVQDAALVREDLDNQRLLVATYGDWKKDIRPSTLSSGGRGRHSLKFYSKPPRPSGKDAEILRIVQQAVERPDPCIGNNLSVIMVGSAPYEPPGDPVSSADQIQRLRTQLQQVTWGGGSIARSTALHVACEHNSLNLVKLLLELDPSAVNIKSRASSALVTPLMTAAQNAGGRLSINGIDDTTVIDYLLSTGANKNLTDSVGHTAYGHFRKKSADWVNMTQPQCRSKLVLLESKLCPTSGPTQMDMAGGNGRANSSSGFVDYGPEDDERDRLRGEGRYARLFTDDDCYEEDDDY